MNAQQGELPRLPPLDARIPQWPPQSLVDRKCPLCGRNNPHVLSRPDGLPVAYCLQCNLWYVSRAPDENTLIDWYRGYWRTFRPYELTARTAAALRRTALEDAKGDLRFKRLGALSTLQGSRFLDVGCGIGVDLVKADALGAKVTGVDIAPEACAFVSRHLGFKTNLGNLEDAQLPSDSMDVIMMADLVEHPLGLRRLLDESLRILAPRGLLVFWTPNGGAAGTSCETAKEWVGFRVDLEHMQYLTADSVVLLAGQYSCTVEHLESLDTPKLDDIDRPQVCKRAQGTTLRGSLSRIPGVRRIRNAAFSFIEKSEVKVTERDGNFRLFSILRKKGSA